MYRSSLLIAVSAVVFLGACSNAELIKQTEQTKPAGSSFAKGMYADYLDLAKSEEGQGDRTSAKHYLTKAGLAASGKEVGPDDPMLRNIAGPEEAPIKSGYDKLNAALKSGAGKRKPAEAAKAQTMLDCWMEQAEEGYQPSDIKTCRTGFETALAALGDTMKSADRALPPSGSPFTVNFKFDSVALTEESQHELNEILKKASIYNPKSVRIVAYTDLVGDKAYNQKLSSERASALGEKLKAAGAKEVVTAAKGASDPAVNTKKANLRNRRAVITFE